MKNKKTELAHHGVKGMKWGIRHDRESSGRKTAIGKQAVNKQAKKKDWSTKKKIAVGAAIVGSMAISGIVLYKTGAFDKLVKKGRDAVGYGGVDLDVNSLLEHGFKQSNRNLDVVDSFFETNPHHNKLIGSNNNCVCCAVCDFLKGKGIQCQAAMAVDIDPVSGMLTKKGPGAFKFSEVENAFPGTKTRSIYNASSIIDVKNNIAKYYKDGSEGLFGCTMLDVDGEYIRHAVKFKVEKRRVILSDSQSATSLANKLIQSGFSEKEAKRKVYSLLSDLSDSYMNSHIRFDDKMEVINLSDANSIIYDEVRKFINP